MACYNDQPQKRYNLESAYRCESKTRQFPFVIASEISPDDKLKSEIESSDAYEGCYDGKSPTREFLVFHDIEHFLNLKAHYPYCHEIIRCPSKDKSRPDAEIKSNDKAEDEPETGKEDLCKGRLIFDFDLSEPLSSLTLDEKVRRLFVPADFKRVMQDLIKYVFNTYYVGVDTDKFLWIWQITRYEKKFSMHLIIKNSYFSEYWVKQMRIFYELLKQSASKFTTATFNCEEYLKALDDQIPRKNATFRMIGCSKINGLPLELDIEYEDGLDEDGYEIDDPLLHVNIYDCLVGIYHVDQLQQEQCITMSNINYQAIQDAMEDVGSDDDNKQTNQKEPNNRVKVPNKLKCPSASLLKAKKRDTELRRFKSVMNKNLSIGTTLEKVDVTSNDINRSVELFEAWNDGSFSIRDQVENIINLNRVRASECKLSGHVHERENGYLKMHADGRLTFHCRRGCTTKPSKAGYNGGENNKGGFGAYGIDLGMYRNIKRPEGIIPLNANKLALVQNAKTYIVGLDGEIVPIKPPEASPGPFIQTESPSDNFEIKAFDPNSRVKLCKSAKRVQIGAVSTVQIPNFLRVK